MLNMVDRKEAIDNTDSVLKEMKRLSNKEIENLPRIKMRDLNKIVICNERCDFDSIFEEFKRERFVGFDSETRTSFSPHIKYKGPHVVQFATSQRSYLILSFPSNVVKFISRVMTSTDILKVGFDLQYDIKLFQENFGLTIINVLDLITVFSVNGFKSVGVKAAIAMLFNRYMIKNKKITLSNWAARPLKLEQVLYASNDVFTALLIFYELCSLGCAFDEQPLISASIEEFKHKCALMLTECDIDRFDDSYRFVQSEVPPTIPPADALP
eukprot:GDKK01023436.1.p1 GENE.GDKK01023436.1~~GDKK01023436.1.p1  ORF type:complete len:269 (-),score=39.63 GDKK01023436.1:514-1320(-)